ncbi:phage major capsid protein [Actinopolymorpha pittospori]
MADVDYRARAMSVLETRAEIIKRAQAESRELTEDEANEVSALEDHAARMVEQGEREARVNGLDPKTRSLTVPRQAGNVESRSWAGLLPSVPEYRASLQTGVDNLGGVTVPDEVASDWAEYLRKRSVVMSIIPAANVVPFTSGSVALPVLQAPANKSAKVAELGSYADAGFTFGKKDFQAVKIGSKSAWSWELEEDSPLPIRNMIAQALLNDLADQIDNLGLNGVLATNGINGIVTLGTHMTPLTAGSVIGYSDLNDAYAAVEGTGANPTHVLVSTDVAKALRDAEDSAGNRITDPTLTPANSAYGLPRLTAGNLPANTAVVLDASRLHIGNRASASVLFDESGGWDVDEIRVKVRSRVAGLTVIEATSIQVVTVAGS